VENVHWTSNTETVLYVKARPAVGIGATGELVLELPNMDVFFSNAAAEYLKPEDIVASPSNKRIPCGVKIDGTAQDILCIGYQAPSVAAGAIRTQNFNNYIVV
jgi:hypothetical protein